MGYPAEHKLKGYLISKINRDSRISGKLMSSTMDLYDCNAATELESVPEETGFLVLSFAAYCFVFAVPICI